jgi:hypothetical protein
MNIGFTGTRNGMTEKQKLAFAGFIEDVGTAFMFHHGDCVGADDEAATIVHESGWGSITVHPPTDRRLAASNPYGTFTLEAKPYLTRNRDIVDACEFLVVVPKETEHQSRGGTWYTHDYAEKKRKTTVIIWPDGTVETTRPIAYTGG